MQPQALTLDPKILLPNPWNTNFVSPENEEKLDAAITRLGMFKPVIVREIDAGYEILGGEHRAASAGRLGMTEIPVMNLGRIDDKLAKEIGIADNSRYGADDTIGLAELMSELGSAEDLSAFLPYTDADMKSIFASVDIALDDLELDADSEKSTGEDDIPSSRAPKTHSVMRFKVAMGDAEKIAALISKIQKRHGFNLADEMTNAGDALVHLLLSGDPDDQSVLTDDEDETL